MAVEACLASHLCYTASRDRMVNGWWIRWIWKETFGVIGVLLQDFHEKNWENYIRNTMQCANEVFNKVPPCSVLPLYQPDQWTYAVERMSNNSVIEFMYCPVFFNSSVSVNINSENFHHQCMTCMGCKRGYSF